MSEVPIILGQFLDKDGDGTGDVNATEDYSDVGLGRTRFYIQPPPGRIYVIETLIVSMSDVGSMDSNAYGNNITLTNGVHIHVEAGTPPDETLIHHVAHLLPILTNGDYIHNVPNIEIVRFGQGNEHLSIPFNFKRDYGVPIRLDGNAEEYLALWLHDDFTGLEEHYAKALGYIENKWT